MTASIVGIGTWLPEAVRTNDAWPASFGERTLRGGDRTFNDIPLSEDPVAAALVERDLGAEASDPFLGAKRRHVAADEMRASDAELVAAKRALADAGIDGADVGVVLTYSTVADRLTPTSSTVAHGIGARRAHAFGVDTACASGVTQLEIARAYVDSGLARAVLLVQSHLLLRTMPMEHPASPGLGDAATAMVVADGPGLAIRATFCHTHGEFADAVTWIRGTTDETDPPWWKPGGDFRVGSRAPELAKALMRDTVSFGAKTVREAAAAAGIDVERLAALASVQPRGFIPGAIAEHLGLPRERAVTTYAHIAHVGSCGPVFNLVRAREEGRLGKGAFAALYAQGAGFTRSAAVLEATR
ncbi:MAG TPA: 3-oxoacyl-[acyl-carrier-protein] synthase III C-terminal domain-containing protein [Polyangiaceae bacterium]|jgi:3-oxoacyl-[acyl-carrier-protein] synthase-3|nr:3-oxoacyl-[acyl-carrier-protein] synthase III C-terminal domain-containing protein [Polyangiaceae bacterium]